MMEVQSENKCPNPACDAVGDEYIAWGERIICDSYGDGPCFTKQGATCSKCGAMFTEYFTLVYQGTEYIPADFENPYNLSATEDCSPNHHQRCVNITYVITEILQKAVELAKDGQDTTDNGYFCCLCERIVMLRYAGVGVGHADTDESIIEVYRDMLMDEIHISEAAATKARKFFRMIHE